jgi:hypothetical protein
MHTSSRFFARSLATGALALVALTATRAAAQDAVAPAGADQHQLAPGDTASDFAAATTTAPARAAVPSLAGARAAVSAPVAAATHAPAAAMQARAGLQQSQVLMIVGGSALVVGILIGDDAGQILALGGAVVGLYGLYQYLKTNG